MLLHLAAGHFGFFLCLKENPLCVVYFSARRTPEISLHGLPSLCLAAFIFSTKEIYPTHYKQQDTETI